MKKKPALLLTVCAVFCIYYVSAQTPVIEWQHCFGSSSGDYLYYIEPTSDGGFIANGYTEENNGDVVGYHGNTQVADYWVLKLDSGGKITWKKCLGGDYTEEGTEIHQTPDGGYIAVGFAASKDCNSTGNHGGVDYWVVKLDANGETQWEKSFGGSQTDYANSISLTKDGGYIVAGDTESTDGDITKNNGGRDFWVVKLNGAGDMLWQKSIGGSSDEEASSVKATDDGGCIVAGYSTSGDGDVLVNHGKEDCWIVKLSGNGNLEWQKDYGGSERDIASSIQLTPDGGYIMAAFTESHNGDVSGNHGLPGARDYWLVKLNNTGAIQWQKCYGGDGNETALFVQLTADGGYVMAGSAETASGDVTCNAGTEDAWVVKVNGTGKLEWEKSFGGSNRDWAQCVQPLSDGSFIVGGLTTSNDVTGYHPCTSSCGDYWIVKLSAPLSSVPPPSVIIDPESAKICSGHATLTTSVRYAGVKYKFNWKRNGVDMGINTDTCSASDFKDNDMIVCTITCGGTCDLANKEVSDTIILTNNALNIQPAIGIISENTGVCNCNPLTFIASVTGAGAGSSPGYTWLVNDVNTGSTGSSFTSKTLGDGDLIKCVYSDKTACVTNATVVSNIIRVESGSNATPYISIKSSTNGICKGTPVTFSSSIYDAGSNPSFQWKINGVNQGTNSSSFTAATLSIGDVVTCILTVDPLFAICAAAKTATSNSVSLNVLDPAVPLVTISAPNTTICKGASITFSAATVNAGTNPTYTWYVNAVKAGTNQSTFTGTGFNNADIVNCTVYIDPLEGCVTTNTTVSNNLSVTLSNGITPSVNITALNNDVCAGSPVTFNAVAANAGTSPAYQWLLNNVATGSNSPVYNSNSLKNGDQISCGITPGAGACSALPAQSNTVTAVINDIPKITISPADTVVVAASQIQLNATIGGIVSSFAWSPAAALENPSVLSPKTVPLAANTTYTLTAETDKGCMATGTAIVKIFRKLNVPGAFTPNGDGRNDVFRIPPEVSLKLDEFSIYDRWGDKIFTSRNISEGWNGLYKGRLANPGTYVYIISGSDENGKVLLKGSFVLIR